MKVSEIISAHGHENIQSTNKATFEITMENHLTKRGDCIIAVCATKGAAGLNPQFRNAASVEGALMTIEIEAGEEKDGAGVACGFGVKSPPGPIAARKVMKVAESVRPRSESRANVSKKSLGATCAGRVSR